MIYYDSAGCFKGGSHRPKMAAFCTQSDSLLFWDVISKFSQEKMVLELNPCKKCTVRFKIIVSYICSPPWWGSMTSILTHLPTILYWTIGPSSCWIALENILLLKQQIFYIFWGCFQAYAMECTETLQSIWNQFWLSQFYC